MGQYYRPILGDKYGLNCKVFDRSVDGQYTLAKLLEHSWWNIRGGKILSLMLSPNFSTMSQAA